MQANDIETLNSIRKSLSSDITVAAVDNAVITNPAREVESSLAGFLKHRLAKLQEATSFEDQVKEALLARIGEANFTQLIGLLEVVQKNNNLATEKILAPFITQGGGKTVTETMREAERGPDASDKVYDEVNDKAILQSLAALGQFFEMASKKSS
jgi:hypothetical protein